MSDKIIEQMTAAIQDAIPGSTARVTAGFGPGHFNVEVVSAAFAGRSMVQAHRMVYSAIQHLMQGDQAPVHAIDQLQTRSE